MKNKFTSIVLSATLLASLAGLGGTVSVYAVGPQLAAGGSGVLAGNFQYKTDAEIQAENLGAKNPYGLVYRGALTKNEAGKVNIHPISYMSGSVKIAANVYTPAGWSEKDARKYPAIVVAHPNGGVKEQVAGLFAERMAQQGYVTIAADAAYQGASGGEPHGLDIPASRVEDIHRMADIIAQFPGVDPDRLAALGICGGGGYTVKAAQSDKRFKAVATLSMFNSGMVRRNGFLNTQSDMATIQKKLADASKARAQAAAGGAVQYTPDTAKLTPEEASKLPFDLYREGYDYYAVTHAHKNSTFAYTVASLMDLMTFDSTDQIGLINAPLLMMAGSAADTLYMTEDAFGRATGTNDKELYLIPGATHIQTYFVPKYVDFEVNKVTDFFRTRV